MFLGLSCARMPLCGRDFVYLPLHHRTSHAAIHTVWTLTLFKLSWYWSPTEGRSGCLARMTMPHKHVLSSVHQMQKTSYTPRVSATPGDKSKPQCSWWSLFSSWVLPEKPCSHSLLKALVRTGNKTFNK